METLVVLILSFLIPGECNQLDGYEFPVYSTESCPRNQSEWDKRSSAINCTKDNGYMCIPNEDRTQLLEFCYIYPQILITKETCLYMYKSFSRVDAYNCNHFRSGCPSSVYFSSEIFKYPSCFLIGNGCFHAEPTCTSLDTKTHLQDTTKPIHVESVTRKYITTASTDEKTNQTLKYKEFVIYDEINILPILAGILIPIITFCMLCVICKKGYHCCIRKSDLESLEEVQCIPLLPTTDLNKMPMGSNKEESSLDRAIFEQWQEDNNTFVQTRACKKVEKLVKSQNLVVVTGNSGSGKSAIIQYIALRYRTQGWRVKPIYSVNEIIDACSRQDALDRTLLVFNDPIGNESFDEEKYKLWKDHEERLQGCLRKIKMLVSCRRYILNDARVRGILKDTCTCIIDLSDDHYKLDNGEKQNMLERFSSNSGFSKEDINEIIKTEEYFPLLCKLYFSDKKFQKMGVKFFKEPFDICQEEIRYFRTYCKEKYCALVLLVLFNNQLCMQDILRSEQSRKKFEIALRICRINMPSYIIYDTLKTLQGFLVKKIGDTYHFYHDFVMDVTTYVFGTEYPLETIQYADIGFLRRRVNLESSNDQKKEAELENGNQINNRFTICLNDRYVCDLGERLFIEIFGERMLDVVLNPCMRNKKVATFFIQKLNENPDKLSKLLAKYQLHKKFRHEEVNRASEQSIDSKLDFLFYEDKVSILHAIIVFCHTSLSKYCLKALKGKKTSLKGKNLFSPVCCNGSMELFNVFPKEQIKTLLMENWGYYYPIHVVSMFHNHEILLELIRVKNDVNLSTGRKYGYTPLMLTAFNTDPSEQNNENRGMRSIDITVELLLNHGADINLGNLICRSPLHVACSNGYDYTVQLLLDKGADINSYDTKKETPLHKACEKGHKSTVHLLLDRGADINSCYTNEETPLHKAIKQGRESIVQLLLDKGANINSCDSNKDTLLRKASQWGLNSTVKLLLDKGADINSCDTYKITPLHKASKRGRVGTIQLLLDEGADINACDTNNETPLHKAISWGYESIVQVLLDKGADINSCDTNKETPLHKAIKQGHERTVQLLLNKGADINSCDTNNETPLHKASKWGHESTVQLLLDKGADINSYDTKKETPLHKACEKGHKSIVQCLLNNGADINSCDTNNESPLHKASKLGHESTVQLLLDKGANINSCDKNNETPLHKASKWGQESTVQLLLDKGADIISCDTNNETP